MTNYDIGYGKPPKGTRFKPGHSGNSGGRPKRKPVPIADQIYEILDAPITYREGGRTVFTTRQELCFRVLVTRAAGGDIGAAEILLKIRERAERYGDAGINILHISDWLPDYMGQTGEQKTRDASQISEAPSRKWWQPEDDQ
jgi:hypothetical protein